MQIVDVRAHVLEAPLSQPFSYSRAWYATRTSLIVETTTDAGADIGIRPDGHPIRQALLTIPIEHTKGVSPSRRPRSWQVGTPSLAFELSPR
jgi:hypothetical protein